MVFTDSAAMVVDLTAEFQGQSRSSFAATFAAATSFTSPKARYLFFGDANPANRDKNQVIFTSLVWKFEPILFTNWLYCIRKLIK